MPPPFPQPSCGLPSRYEEEAPKDYGLLFPTQFDERFTNWEGEVKTLEELLGLEFVKRWSDHPELGFTRFSVSTPYPEQSSNYHHLMAEIRDEEWWVAAILKGPSNHPIIEALPKWQSPQQTQKSD